MPTAEEKERVRYLGGLRYTEPDLDPLPQDLPDLDGKTIICIGASFHSGFAYNFGKMAAMKGADVLLTTLNDKENKRLKRNATNFNFQTAVCDVTNHDHIRELEEKVRVEYGRADVILVAPAYLDPAHIGFDKEYDSLPGYVRRKCESITVYPVSRITRAFVDLLAESEGVTYGVSFSVPDLPGYTVGKAKDMLEGLGLPPDHNEALRK